MISLFKCFIYPIYKILYFRVLYFSEPVCEEECDEVTIGILKNVFSGENLVFGVDLTYGWIIHQPSIAVIILFFIKLLLL